MNNFLCFVWNRHTAFEGKKDSCVKEDFSQQQISLFAALFLPSNSFCKCFGKERYPSFSSSGCSFIFSCCHISASSFVLRRAWKFIWKPFIKHSNFKEKRHLLVTLLFATETNPHSYKLNATAEKVVSVCIKPHCCGSFCYRFDLAYLSVFMNQPRETKELNVLSTLASIKNHHGKFSKQFVQTLRAVVPQLESNFEILESYSTAYDAELSQVSCFFLCFRVPFSQRKH